MDEAVRKASAIVLRGPSSWREVLVFDHPLDGGGSMLQVPAGTVEPGEEPESAAIRELFEESGIQASAPVLVAVLDEEVDGVKRVRWIYLLEAPPGVQDEWPFTCDCGAAIRFHWLPLERAEIVAPQQPWMEAIRSYLRARMPA